LFAHKLTYQKVIACPNGHMWLDLDYSLPGQPSCDQMNDQEELTTENTGQLKLMALPLCSPWLTPSSSLNYRT